MPFPSTRPFPPAASGPILILLLLAALCLRPPVAFAADGPVTGADRAALFERLRAGQAGVRAFRATVLQKKSSPLLLKEESVEGLLLFGNPDRFRWETSKPERLVVVADGQSMTVWSPDRNEAERYDQRDRFAARMAVEFMASGMGGSLADLERRFGVGVLRRGGMLEMTLTPKARWFRRAVASIAVFQREGQPIPERIVVAGPRGDRTETILRDVALNPPLPRDAFTLKLPPGTRLFDAKQRGERGEDAP
jgi:outer membrane lipoprotein-sorting protein